MDFDRLVETGMRYQHHAPPYWLNRGSMAEETPRRHRVTCRPRRCCLIVILLLVSLAPTAVAQPPNIVLIIADDQAWTDFGFMGNQRVHTPNLDALARRSAVFVNGYVPSSVCRPSLATLMTGLYPHQHGIHFNHGPPGNAGYNRMATVEDYHRTRRREFELIGSAQTLPSILRRERGYRSLQTGKFWEGHYRNGGFTDGMTTFEPPPRDQTFGGVRRLAGGQHVAHGNGDAGLQIGRNTMQPIFEFIDACRRSTVPWLVWYAPYLPHQPHDSPEKFYRLARSRGDVAEHELPYFAAIAQFDETVGTLVAHVERNQLANNTVFVFLSDNGWRPSRKRDRNRPAEFAQTERSKRAPFDDGVRTPILIRWDGVIEPARYKGLVSTIDIFPTLLDAAGLSSSPIEETRETARPGLSLMPIAKREQAAKSDRAVFGEIYPGDATSLGHPERDIAYRWVRQGGWKLIVPHARPEGAKPWGSYLDSVALFNMESDPLESENLAGVPEHESRVEQLSDLLDRWWTP